MLTIVHGENLIKSREKLFELKQLAQGSGQQLNTLLAKKINPQKLEESLLAKDLFGQEQCLIIEQLHSLAHSKKRTAYIESIQKASQFLNIVLWEKKSLSKSNLKKFPQAKIFLYPMGKALWQLVDQLSPNPSTKKGLLLLLQQAIEQDSAEFCLSMISKRISDLIAIKVDTQVKMHPFVKNKLEKQKGNITLKQLLNFHQELYKLDHKLKHSHNLLSLASELDLLLITL
jgi:hypothetical protein